MKRICCFLLCATLVACSSLDIDIQDVSDEVLAISDSDLTKSSYSPVSSHYVGTTQVSSIVSSVLDKKIDSIETIAQDGIDVLHVANCEDGWALVATDDRLSQQIIAYSETGSFNPDSISSPEVAFWYEMTKKQLKQKIQSYYLESAESSSIQEESLRSFGMIWCRVPIGQRVISNTISSVDHLLETTWGQHYPWNVNCPIYNIDGDKMPTGCVAVAMSQILYYLHFNLGTPAGLYHQLTPYWSYSYSGNLINYVFLNPLSKNYFTSPSPRWNSMPLNKYGTNTQYVADLMLEVGDEVNMHYNPYGSSATPTTTAFDTFGISSDSSDFNFSNTKTCLDNNTPVLICGEDSNGGGHAWVIDGYYENQQLIEYTYEWRLSLSGSDDWMEADLRISQNAMPSYDPNMFEGKIETIRRIAPIQYLLMNWGWDNSDEDIAMNNAQYYIGSNWPFSENLWIIYNFED